MPENSSAAKALAWLRSRPTPETAGEALALSIHALLRTHGFRSASSDDDATLPAGWGSSGYGGLYKHERSAMSFDIRSNVVATKLVVNAVAVEDDAELHSLALRVEDYVELGNAWEGAVKKMDDLALLVQVQIAHKLVPDAAKEGYEAAAADTSGGGSASQTRPPVVEPLRDSRHEPLRIDPLRDDPLRIGAPRHPGYGVPVPGFGGDDLLAPGLPRDLGVPGRGGMGGNLMGPGNFRRVDPRRPPGVPPGARFDPYGPLGPDNDIERVPGFEDEHGLGGGSWSGVGGAPRGAGRGGGFDDGPPPGMYW